MSEYVARCHCGALMACYRTALPPCNWHIRACQCSFCRTHSALSTSDPAGLLYILAHNPNCCSGIGSAHRARNSSSVEPAAYTWARRSSVITRGLESLMSEPLLRSHLTCRMPSRWTTEMRPRRSDVRDGSRAGHHWAVRAFKEDPAARTDSPKRLAGPKGVGQG